MYFIYFFSCLTEKNTMSYKDTDEYLMIFLRPTHFYAQSAYDLVSEPTTDLLLFYYPQYRCDNNLPLSMSIVANVTEIFAGRQSDLISLFTSVVCGSHGHYKCQHLRPMIITSFLLTLSCIIY